ncbi:signal peptidase II [Microbacterium sp. HD4P20]|uniref:signal peptidase II n=1 Tax=Microbacterium sp. HD4P20 TaxID=2864874 RepID=UPI001C6427F0|nr:signal peptidase II [Microbacterium sp. HD4P20]MCP2637118.1 signal peptidase II [Microbacterium sp. HD4P20]
MTDRPRPLRSSKGRHAAAGAIIAILAVLVLAADQFAKHVALENLPYQETVPVFGDFLSFYLTRNPGAAFSLGEGVTWIFTIALAVVAGVIVWLAATRVTSRLWAVALGLLLGGVLGNLTDRILREPGFAVGHVVDFINTPWMWFFPGMSPAIYNIADIFIVSMMIGVAILVLVGIHLDGTRERRTTDDHDEGSTDATSGLSAASETSGTVAADPLAPPSEADGGPTDASKA